VVEDGNWLVERFEAHRPRLHSVAHRMLGSAAEADDALQEAWLRLSRSGAEGVQNMGGWLTTIVARVSLMNQGVPCGAGRGVCPDRACGSRGYSGTRPPRRR
jgi:hypothetical protein